VVLALWQVGSLRVGPLLLPSPSAVFGAVVREIRNGQLIAATLSSLEVFAAGYALAVVTGTALGLMLGGLPRIGDALDIYVDGLNSTPRIAFVPLIILWLGLGTGAKIAVVWLLAVLPIVINTCAGVRQTDPELLEAARSFGAGRRQLFRYIMLPAAMPYVVAGLRLGSAAALVGTVVAELYTSLDGLGYLIAQFGGSFQTAEYFGPVLVLGVLGVLVSQALKLVERRFERWRR
jgi:ABC-type nitrate/sulfonate/bicarbonate transport system permease component